MPVGILASRDCCSDGDGGHAQGSMSVQSFGCVACATALIRWLLCLATASPLVSALLVISAVVLYPPQHAAAEAIRPRDVRWLGALYHADQTLAAGCLLALACSGVALISSLVVLGLASRPAPPRWHIRRRAAVALVAALGEA